MYAKEMMSILIERDGGVVIVNLNRPKVLNALNSEIMRETVERVSQSRLLDHSPMARNI